MNPVIPTSEPLRILAVGNSFSVDAMCYLWDIFRAGGIKTVTLGNLYYPACSLAGHLDFAQQDQPAYTYFKNTSGSWEPRTGTRLCEAVADEAWDIITFQQTSKTCGLAETYGKVLTDLLDFVRSRAPQAVFVWHMTWAYQQDSTHQAFRNYGNDQNRMYRMTLDCVEHCIRPEPRFRRVIPSGISIQNARASFLGDTLTRDGYHLDLTIGRYIAGLTWFSALTGLPAETVDWAPEGVTPEMLSAAREAVNAAVASPEIFGARS